MSGLVVNTGGDTSRVCVSLPNGRQLVFRCGATRKPPMSPPVNDIHLEKYTHTEVAGTTSPPSHKYNINKVKSQKKEEKSDEQKSGGRGLYSVYPLAKTLF